MLMKVFMPNIAIIVDLETTGLNSNLDHIIEIGAIKVDLDTGEVMDQFQTFSLPEEYYYLDEDDEDYNEDDIDAAYELDPFIVALTGITNEMLIGAPSNEIAVEAFFNFASDFPIWAYNASFDSRFLNVHTEEHKRLIDILSIARRVYPNLANYKLVTVAEHLNFSSEGAHRAIADCLLSKEVLVRGLQIQGDNPSIYHHGFKATDYAPKEEGLFYGKNIVFTGALVTMTRDGAAEHASRFGFKIGSSVTKNTDYLVVGIQDLGVLAGHEKSTKHRKAEELIGEGIKIQIITENVFLSLIK